MLEELALDGWSSALELLLGELFLAEHKVSEATACFMSVLSEDPRDKDALRAVIELHRRAGDLESAYAMSKRLLELVPSAATPSPATAAASAASRAGAGAGAGSSTSTRAFAESARFAARVIVDYGTAAKAGGDAARALDLYCEALSAVPDFDSALYHMGVLAWEQGRAADAVALYRRATKTNALNVQAWTNLGVLLRDGGDLAGAQAALQEALGLAPDHPVVLHNLAALYVHIGSLGGAAARAAYERALAYDPANTDALYNLGVLEGAAERWEMCLFYYQACVRLNARHCNAWNNLGVVYQQLDNPQRAVECYEAAVAARPDFWLSLNNLGVVYTAQGHAARGQRHLRAAIAARADYAEAHNNMGVLLRDMGFVREAIVAYEECMRLSPNSPNAFQNRLLALNYILPGESPAVCEAHADWGRMFQAKVSPLAPVPRALRARGAAGRAPQKRLRIGYISPDLYRHSVSYFIEAPLQHHDRSRVELFIYCSTPRPDSKSRYLRGDALAAGATWRRVVGMADADVARAVRADGVDVLIELTGHTANNRLGVMRYRAAPVQVTWIGYPNSTGLPSIDYRITDAVSDPLGTRQTYVERLLRLPGCFLCYTPMRDPPQVAPAPCLTQGFVTFGSFNALAKVTDEVIETWCSILAAVPKSRLVLKNKPFACAETRGVWLRRFAARGVARWRVELLPLTTGTAEHMSQYSLIDISLDPWPYAGTTTTCESLFMGVPCITLAGGCHAHNVGVTLLAAVGLAGDWVARSQREYVALARAWARRPAQLVALRARLRASMLASPLCDAPAFVRGLEGALEGCFNAWLQERTGEAEAPAEAPEPSGPRSGCSQQSSASRAEESWHAGGGGGGPVADGRASLERLEETRSAAAAGRGGEPAQGEEGSGGKQDDTTDSPRSEVSGRSHLARRRDASPGQDVVGGYGGDSGGSNADEGERLEEAALQ